MSRIFRHFTQRNALYLLISLLPLGLLSGCATPVLVAGAAGGAVLAKDPRSANAILEDQVIETKVRDNIYSDASLKDKVHINITSYNGVVLLTGEALSRPARAKALRLAKLEPRVRRIYNEVRIDDLTDLSSRTRDGWITTKVKSSMLTTKNFPDSQIKVVTEFGSVYLMGMVSRDVGKQAADIARNIDGVKRVVKLFEYQ